MIPLSVLDLSFVTSGGSGATGRASAQKIISAPNTSMARPVQRSMLIPAALFLM